VSLQSSLDIKCSSTMAALKTTLVLLLIAFAMLASVGATRVGPCDQVCSRIDAEKDECCRAHGHSGYSSCKNGKMNCY
ncbi:hypothetical protein, partial [Klebsiella pneumoniae]|uniref:hypothetical protein n=1 Tax=Klebsiella pneumoniae TaxID=573 RepID=UPI0025A1630A